MEAKGVKFDSPRLELAKKDDKGVPVSTGQHMVKILRDERRDDIHEFTGTKSFKEVVGIRYWFDENGVEKYYDVPLFKKGTKDEPNYLISKFGELEEGDKIVIEFVKNGDRGFIDIKKVDADIPSINLDEGDEPGAKELEADGGGEDIPLDDVPF